MIIEVDIYSMIRQRHLNGESQRQIAKALGISRQTVKKYCTGDTHPDVRKPYTREPSVISDDVRSFILSCFQEDKEENVPKQKHTAKKIHSRLVKEKKFKGAYSTVRAAVRELKAEQRVPPQSCIPLSFEPGEAIQVDWGMFTCYLDGKRMKLQIFCARLSYSCDIFVQVFPRQNQESFLEAQQRMIDYFGGVPRKVLFDNAKVAVKEGFGLYAVPQNKYLSFSAHYGFLPEFCNPAKGNEKGLVENLVGYGRRNFLVPLPRVKSVDELNRQLWKDCLEYRNNHQIQTRTNTVLTMYNEEVMMLRKIPKYRFDSSRTIIAKVNDFSTVRFDKNNYSVPTKYLRKDVTVKGFANQIHIISDGSKIVEYTRCYEKFHTEYRLEHYIDLIERKPRSVSNAKPVKETLTKELLEWARLLPGGNKEMVKLLRLCVDHGEEKILNIKHRIPQNMVPTVDMVRSYLNPPLEPEVVYLNNEIKIAAINLERYDEKYGVMNR